MTDKTITPPPVKKTSGETMLLETQTPAKLINAAFLNLLRQQLQDGIYGNDKQKGKLSAAICGALENLSPKDEIEAMLVGQILLTNNAAMECYKASLQSNWGGCPYSKDEVELANKCIRTFAVLVDTLNRYRGKGNLQQTITVQHVNVNDGGQAIVGNIGTQGRGE